MDQLLVQVDEGGSRPCGVEGGSLVEYGEVGRCWLLWSASLCRRARPCGGERAPVGESAPLWGRALPSGEGRALVAYLIGRGLKHLLITC
jgi:hypothetical protein